MKRLASWLLVWVFGGKRPGRGALKLPEPDGSYDLWVFDGDVVEIYAHDRETGSFAVRRSMSPRNATKLARRILKWWVWSLWCGAKITVWNWCVRNRAQNSSGEAQRAAKVIEMPNRMTKRASP
jgi:hypothetical protein